MEWTINAIPFGGFVRMEGESGDSSHPHAFSNRPLAWRMLVICGGVIMNFLLGWGLLTASFMIGIQMPNTEVGSISIGKLIDGMPASLSDLKENDTILQIDSTDITSYENFLSILKNDAEKKQSAKFTILRNDKKIEIKISPNEDGLFGIVPFQKLKTEKYNFIDATKKAFTESFVIMKGSINAIGNLKTSLTTKHEIPEEIGGPVAIASTTDMILEKEDGVFTTLVLFTATLSLSLAVLNIMPFPGLDGGRLFFLIGEGVMRFFAQILLWFGVRKKSLPTQLPEKLEILFHTIGYIVLLGLIIWITWNDISRIFF